MITVLISLNNLQYSPSRKKPQCHIAEQRKKRRDLDGVRFLRAMSCRRRPTSPLQGWRQSEVNSFAGTENHKRQSNKDNICPENMTIDIAHDFAASAPSRPSGSTGRQIVSPQPLPTGICPMDSHTVGRDIQLQVRGTKSTTAASVLRHCCGQGATAEEGRRDLQLTCQGGGCLLRYLSILDRF